MDNYVNEESILGSPDSPLYLCSTRPLSLLNILSLASASSHLGVIMSAKSGVECSGAGISRDAIGFVRLGGVAQGQEKTLPYSWAVPRKWLIPLKPLTSHREKLCVMCQKKASPLRHAPFACLFSLLSNVDVFLRDYLVPSSSCNISHLSRLPMRSEDSYSACIHIFPKEPFVMTTSLTPRQFILGDFSRSSLPLFLALSPPRF